MVDAEVREHRARVGVDEQARGERDDQVAVGDALAEDRVRRGGLGVHVGVERVAGELGEVLDVLLGDGPRPGDDRVAGPQLLQVLAERVHVGRRRSAPATQRPVIAVRVSGSAWMAVRCMWCSTPRMPPSSSPPPARPGPPCTSSRHRRAVAGRLLRVAGVEHQQPAVPGRDAEHDLARERRIGGDDRAREAALPAGGELDHLLGGGVGEHGGDRAERLHLVRLGPLRVADQQDRGDERAALGVGVDQVDLLRVAEHDPPGVGQRLDAAPDLLALLQARQRAHPDALLAGLPTVDLRQPGRHGLHHGVDVLGGHEGPPDRGALLARP